ncbi:hypothetical protein B0H67DRAFT_640326 [Lasiosphaeris hirsuta]|uniref:Zn(2)-C6 fungal-type domain-containing protein n=1 Tax=Lasiosphaeris hirsuta TaxID=260670 RepID=A0AA40BD74_9PEZI|nr:hypothetical protein B0H67DRAFT_640326 [Lasiosphaeris hirsuta]
MPDTEGLHRCPVCFKGYKRCEHLHLQGQRSSHNAERPHRCILCNASFQRTDVLKRHSQTCDGGSAASTGRRRACDRCVRQKKACNSVQPCQICEKRAVQCQYSNANPSASAARLQTDTPAESAESAGGADDISVISDSTVSSIGLTRPRDAAAGIEQASFSDISSLIQSTVSHFPLLDDQASSHDCRTGLVSSFDCAALEHRHQIVSSFNHAYLERQRLGPFMVGALPFIPLDESDCTSYATTGVTGGDLASWSYWLHDPTMLRPQEIVLLVKSVVTMKPNNSSVTLTWSSALEQECLQFFLPYRVAKFLELYWSVWHPNVNIAHRPTFDPTTSKPMRVAFIRYSPEYWLLGSLLIERISATITTAQEKPRNKDRSSGAFFEDIAGQIKSIEPILDKYDQTSMRQVNDLHRRLPEVPRRLTLVPGS